MKIEGQGSDRSAEHWVIRRPPSALHTLALPHVVTPVDPSLPIGLTVMLGGSKYRVAISVAGKADPVSFSIGWDALRAEAEPEVRKRGVPFAQCPQYGWPLASDKLAGAIDRLYGGALPDAGRNVCTLTFSVAGLVDGEGADARVTTSNTGLEIVNVKVRDLLRAVNSAFYRNGWPPISESSVRVVNDAVAALIGEQERGALRGVKNGYVLIIGTGLGGAGITNSVLNPFYKEAGHALIWDEKTGNYTVKAGQSLNELVNADGAFIQLPPGYSYLEHRLAGPWLATHLVQRAAKDLGVYQGLQRRVCKIAEVDVATVRRELRAMSVLSPEVISKWNNMVSPDVVRGVLGVLFASPHNTLQRDCAQGDQSAGFLLRQWHETFDEYGRAFGAWHAESVANRQAFERIVLVGGLPEFWRRCPQESNDKALEIVHRVGRIPSGTVCLTEMSPESREATCTSVATDRTAALLGSIREG
jgi:hypothetical protein